VSRLIGWMFDRANPAFAWLWWSQTVSMFGSQVTIIAIPLVAFLTLGATALEMGYLAAAETLPYLLFSIPAGVLVDRVDRRNLLIATNLLRALILLAVPLGLVLGVLRLELLYAVALLVGSLSVVFDVAYQSYLPELVQPAQLLRGNQKIELSESAARTVGPTIGGALVAATGAAAAIVVDAASYVIASIALIGARKPHASRAASPVAESVGANTVARPFDIWDYAKSLETRVAELESRFARQQRPRRDSQGAAAGLRIVLGDRILRDMALSTGIFNLASSAIFAVFFLYAARDLALGPAEIGFLYGTGNIGFVVGALVVGVVTSRFGIGPTLILSGSGGALAMAIFPFASGPFAAAFLLAGRFLGAFTIPLFNVNVRALRQSRTPVEALGRVNSVFRLIDWGTLPVGALLGGWIGTYYGLRDTLIAAAALGIVSALWLTISPLAGVRRLDENHVSEPATSAADVGSAGRRWIGAASGLLGRPFTALRGFPSIRWTWLAIGGAAVEVALAQPSISSQLGGAPPYLYVLANVAVLVCLLVNLRIPGLAIAALGGLSNLVAIIFNGGYMPVDPAAAAVVGHPATSGYTHTVQTTAVYLRVLTDIIVVPPPLPFTNVYSVGDLLLLIGLSVTVVAALHGWAAHGTTNAGARTPPLTNEYRPPMT
jgi:MFS family permease